MTDYDPNDELLDERIRALAAGHYNAPDGTVPRDAMWERIAAARRAARRAPAERDAAVLPIAARRRPRTIVVWRWSAALAAGLLLAFALGRELGHRETATGPTQVARAGSMPSSAAAGSRVGSAAPPPGSAAAESTIASARQTIEPSRQVASTEGTRAGRASDVDGPPPRRDVAPAEPRDAAVALYRAAAAQTLVQAEAVLTAYRDAEGDARDPQAMQQAARWARDVLSSTRLLMDSPAGRDSRMRSLFVDLELVLAQIVQLSGTPLDAGERELIDRAMRDRDLLPRLRSVVPAGSAAS